MKAEIIELIVCICVFLIAMIFIRVNPPVSMFIVGLIIGYIIRGGRKNHERI